MGIWEDPATGTAAGPLVARLVAAGKVPDHTTAIVEQGALHLAEEVATIGGQVALARRPPSCDAGSEGALGQRGR